MKHLTSNTVFRGFKELSCGHIISGATIGASDKPDPRMRSCEPFTGVVCFYPYTNQQVDFIKMSPPVWEAYKAVQTNPTSETMEEMKKVVAEL